MDGTITATDRAIRTRVSSTTSPLSTPPWQLWLILRKMLQMRQQLFRSCSWVILATGLLAKIVCIGGRALGQSCDMRLSLRYDGSQYSKEWSRSDLGLDSLNEVPGSFTLLGTDNNVHGINLRELALTLSCHVAANIVLQSAQCHWLLLCWHNAQMLPCCNYSRFMLSIIDSSLATTI